MPLVGAQHHHVVGLGDVGQQAVLGGAHTEPGVRVGEPMEVGESVADGSERVVALAERVDGDHEVEPGQTEALDRDLGEVHMGDRGRIERTRVDPDGSVSVVARSHRVRLAIVGE